MSRGHAASPTRILKFCIATGPSRLVFLSGPHQFSIFKVSALATLNTNGSASQAPSVSESGDV
jgi:hypothetical protein